MSIIETLITDRNASDVLDLTNLLSIPYEKWTEEQKEKFDLGNSKGAYNATDLNRVGEAMIYLAERFNSYGYTIEVAPKTDWLIEDIPTAEQMAYYLGELAKVREVYAVLETTPQVPSDMNKLTYQEANDIEQILTDIEFVINQVVRSFARSNADAFWSGNRPFPSAENDMGRTWEQLDEMNTTWANWQVADWYLLLYGNLKAEGVVE